MGELKYAITAVEIIIGVLVAVALGDYLSYKIGRWRLAAILGGIALVGHRAVCHLCRRCSCLVTCQNSPGK